MKSLQKYLTESAKTYEFRLKTAQELSDDQLDMLEKHLRKYDAFDVESPRRTILQRAPLDFYNLGATEVFIIDFKTRLPLSPAMLVNELVQKLGIGEGHIRVRNKLEPAEQQDAESMESIEELSKKVDAMLLDDNYSEVKNPKADKFYGEKHKTKFIDELTKARKKLTKEYKVKKWTLIALTTCLDLLAS